MQSLTQIASTLFIALTLSVNTAFAIDEIKVEQGSVLSLNDCIAIALNNNPAIKNARYNYNDTNTNKYTTNTNVYSVEATLNQLIWNFGRTNAHIKMQKLDYIKKVI